MDRWTHLAGVYDGSYLHVFVDGKEVAVVPRTSPGEHVRVSASKRPVCIGGGAGGGVGGHGGRRRYTWNSGGFRGAISHVRIFSKALTLDQVREGIHENILKFAENGCLAKFEKQSLCANEIHFPQTSVDNVEDASSDTDVSSLQPLVMSLSFWGKDNYAPLSGHDESGNFERAVFACGRRRWRINPPTVRREPEMAQQLGRKTARTFARIPAWKMSIDKLCVVESTEFILNGKMKH